MHWRVQCNFVIVTVHRLAELEAVATDSAAFMDRLAELVTCSIDHFCHYFRSFVRKVKLSFVENIKHDESYYYKVSGIMGGSSGALTEILCRTMARSLAAAGIAPWRDLRIFNCL
jgi:hypothetical protein